VTEVSRTGRSALNAGVSIGAQVLLICLSFLTRTVFVAQLGTDLLGVQTLLLSVLAMLAVADLGLGGALMFALYKPLHDADYERTTAIVRYAATLYRWVAVAVAVSGLAMLPFLDNLIELQHDVPLLRTYFLILLADSVAGYLMVHRAVLIAADQRTYLVKAYNVVFGVLRSAAQIFVLVVLGSFLWFLVLQVVFTVLNNAFLFWRAGRLYPYLTNGGTLQGSDRRELRHSVRSMLVYRMGGIALHNTDPVLISVLIGTAALGLFSNYLLLVGSVVMLVEAVFSGFTSSVGQLVATGDRPGARRVFEEINLLATTAYGFVALALVASLDEFVAAWLGTGRTLGSDVVVALALNVYVVGTMAPIWSYRSATGMFHQTQYVLVVTAILNLILSIVLASPLGITGILLATAISRLVTASWFEPWVLLSRHLGGSFVAYGLRQVLAASLWISLSASVLLGQTYLSTSESRFWSLSAVLAAPGLVWLVYHRTAAYAGLVERLQQLRPSLARRME
jgi:O-antigen/teichoic acid export membrane protein